MDRLDFFVGVWGNSPRALSSFEEIGHAAIRCEQPRLAFPLTDLHYSHLLAYVFCFDFGSRIFTLILGKSDTGEAVTSVTARRTSPSLTSRSVNAWRIYTSPVLFARVPEEK